MIEFRRDPETGVVHVYRDGEDVGPVITLGDMIGGEDEDDSEPRKERRA